MADDDQILKCRDDKSPVVLSRQPTESGAEIAFGLAEGSSCSWLAKGESISPDKLRPRIEPWLTALFQSEHFSLLVGSGLTHALHWMAVSKALPGMAPGKFTNYDKAINAEAKRSAESAGRQEGNIEDQLRTANELLRGLEILAGAEANLKDKVDALRKDLSKVLADFAASILAGERGTLSGYDPEVGIALDFNPATILDDAGSSAAPPRPHGMSGCGIWRLVEAGTDAQLWKPDDIKLVAIQHTLKPDHGVLTGTRIRYALQIIYRNHVHLRSAIELHFSAAAKNL